MIVDTLLAIAYNSLKQRGIVRVVSERQVFSVRPVPSLTNSVESQGKSINFLHCRESSGCTERNF